MSSRHAATNTRIVARRALRSLLGDAGLPNKSPMVRMTSGPVSLGSRFHAAEAATAAIAATGVAAGAIAGVPPRLTVHGRLADLSLTSFALQGFADAERAPRRRLAPEARTAAAGFFPTRDGRAVYLHPGFPHHSAKMLELLGVPDDRERVRAAVAGATGEALEDAIAEAGLCGAMVRSAEEWDASLPGRLLAARPAVEVIQLAGGPPRPLPDPARPLTGVNVLDLTRVLAGPACARTLALFGANVLRIGGARLPSVEAFVADTGLGKRNAFLDLREAADRATFDTLLGEADVFSQSYRTGAMDRLGYGPLDVARARPGIVYVSINCYGHEGAWRARPGWEQLAQTVTGMANAHGEERGDASGPRLLPAAVTDYVTGYLAAFGTLVALGRRATDGGSYWVRVSLARTGMWVRGLGLRKSLPEGVPVSEEELSDHRQRVATHWGPLEHLKPAISSKTLDIGWRRPPAPLGAHPPSFA